MATGKQQVTSTFKPTAFCVTLFPPRSSPCHSILLSAQMGESAARKVNFFLSDSGLAACGEGDCGKAGRRGSDVVWPLASFRCSAPRTDGITKDYRATLGSSVCDFIVCLCACAVRLGVCVQACALGPMLRGEWTWVCVCVCEISVPSGQLVCQSLLSCLSHFSHSGELKRRAEAFHGWHAGDCTDTQTHTQIHLPTYFKQRWLHWKIIRTVCLWVLCYIFVGPNIRMYSLV